MFFSLMMRTFRIYLLSNFQIYHTAVLTIVIILYIISPVLIYLTAGSLHPSTPSSDSPTPPLASGNHKSDLVFYEFVFFLN